MEDVYHICIGDILRAERDRLNSPWTEQIQYQMREGGLVCSEISMKLLFSSISVATMAGRRKFILDSFPRDIDQAVLFEKKVRKCQEWNCSLVHSFADGSLQSSDIPSMPKGGYGTTSSEALRNLWKD